MSRSSQLTQRTIAAIVGGVILAGIGVAVLMPPGSPIHAARQGSRSRGSHRGQGSNDALATSGMPARASGGGAGSSAAPAGAGSTSAAAGQVPTVGPAVVQAPPPADTVIRTGSIDLQVSKGGFASAFSAAADVAHQMGGFVVTTETGPTVPTPVPDAALPNAGPSVGPTIMPADNGGNGSVAPTSGTLVLRVPGTRFDDARRQLEGIGRVRQEQLSGQDAGGQLADLGARLADLRAEQEGLRTMAARAANTADLLAIQGQLATVQQQIDGLTAQLDTLHNQVALASITVSVHEPVVLAPGPKSVFSIRTAQARRGVESVLGGILVVLAYAGPLGVLALAGALVVVAHRRRRTARVAPVA